MTNLLHNILGRLPIGWLQLSHNRGRMIAAIAGIAFANLLVFVQLGVMDSLGNVVNTFYAPFDADIIVSSEKAEMIASDALISRRLIYLTLEDASVETAAPLYLGSADWTKPDRSTAVLYAYALPVEATAFAGNVLANGFDGLRLPLRALIDSKIDGINVDAVALATPENPLEFEINGVTIGAVGTFRLGAAFNSDGILAVSDQTFFRMFEQRSARTPNHILVKVKPGEDSDVVAARLQSRLSSEHAKVRTLSTAIADDKDYQSTEMPVGIIFTFGVVIGVMVGLVIVYQVLSTDVVAHLKEYATFKALGYPHRFFLSIIMEEALIVAVMGFVPGALLSWGAFTAMALSTGLPVAMTLQRSVLILLGTIMACAISGALATLRVHSADPADLFA